MSSSEKGTMDPAGGGAKRQRVATAVESALANIDVVSQLAAFLGADDLCQVKATCKALGSANDGAAFNGLSMAEEAARRVYESASDEEKAMLPRYDGESWMELYHHLLMLQGVEYQGDDQAVVRQAKVGKYLMSHAICGNHIMRSGKHWATFTSSSCFELNQSVGVIRPLPGWEKRGLDSFHPSGYNPTSPQLQRERTNRWGGDVHYCWFNTKTGSCYWSDWEVDATKTNWEGYENYSEDCLTLGMLLDLVNGTLSLYQDGQRLGTLKDGLAGEYCWIAGFWSNGVVSIQRGYYV